MSVPAPRAFALPRLLATSPASEQGRGAPSAGASPLATSPASSPASSPSSSSSSPSSPSTSARGAADAAAPAGAGAAAGAGAGAGSAPTLGEAGAAASAESGVDGEAWSPDAAPDPLLVESDRILTTLRCSVYMDALFYCLSPVNQMSTYYRTGLVDDCQVPMQRAKTCFLARLTADHEKRVRLYHDVLTVTGAKSPTSSVWKERDDPAEAWRKA